MLLKECQVAIKEGVAHPCNTEYRHHGVHAGTKHVALHGIVHISLANHQYQRSHRHHDNLYRLRHRHSVQHAIHHKHHHQHTQQKCHHSILGARVRILYHLVYQLAVVLRVYNALCHALLIHLVVYQLLANTVLHKRSHQYRYQRGWNTYHHHILQLYASATQQVGTDNGCRSCRYRPARDAQRSRYCSHAQWSLRSNLRVCRYLRDNRQ